MTDREQLSEMGRALSRSRAPITKVCAICGKEFTGYRRRSQLDGQEHYFCSVACKAKDQRRRRKLAAAVPSV